MMRRNAPRLPWRSSTRAESLGAVESRKIADLLLLDANPLIDIHNVRQIAAVIPGGRYLNKAQLQAPPMRK
jgi:imidazolonepropionase-like amidohydrolase